MHVSYALNALYGDEKGSGGGCSYAFFLYFLLICVPLIGAFSALSAVLAACFIDEEPGEGENEIRACPGIGSPLYHTHMLRSILSLKIFGLELFQNFT